MFRIVGEVRIDWVVIFNRIRWACASLNYARVIVWNPDVLVIIGRRRDVAPGMLPNVSHSEFADFWQRFVGKITELTDAILLDCVSMEHIGCFYYQINA